MRNNYTTEERDLANSQCIIRYLQRIGHPIYKEGNGGYWKSKERSSLVIRERDGYFNWNAAGVSGYKPVELAKQLLMLEGYSENQALIKAIHDLAEMGVYAPRDTSSQSSSQSSQYSSQHSDESPPLPKWTEGANSGCPMNFAYRRTKHLPHGWGWQDFDDGSGSLMSPDGERIVQYDLQTKEYEFDGHWYFMRDLGIKWEYLELLALKRYTMEADTKHGSKDTNAHNDVSYNAPSQSSTYTQAQDNQSTTHEASKSISLQNCIKHKSEFGFHPDFWKKDKNEIRDALESVARKNKVALEKLSKLESPTKNEEALMRTLQNSLDILYGVYIPDANVNNTRIINYLCNERGIDGGIISDCIDKGKIYQSKKFANVVFVSRCRDGDIKHIFLRGIYKPKENENGSEGKSFRMDSEGSDKKYPFALEGKKDAAAVYVFEASIDVLSHATLCKTNGHYNSLYNAHRISLHGTSFGALRTFLADNPKVTTIIPCLDADEAGVRRSKKMQEEFGDKYTVENHRPPRVGNDYNEMLLKCREFGINSPKQQQAAQLNQPALAAHMAGAEA